MHRVQVLSLRIPTFTQYICATPAPALLLLLLLPCPCRRRWLSQIVCSLFQDITSPVPVPGPKRSYIPGLRTKGGSFGKNKLGCLEAAGGGCSSQGTGASMC